jgi:hypothetical protein
MQTFNPKCIVPKVKIINTNTTVARMNPCIYSFKPVPDTLHSSVTKITKIMKEIQYARTIITIQCLEPYHLKSTMKRIKKTIKITKGTPSVMETFLRLGIKFGDILVLMNTAKEIKITASRITTLISYSTLLT